MAHFISQETKPSRTSRTEQAVAYLERDIGRPLLERVMEEYFQSNRNGNQITLACFREVGERRLNGIATRRGKSLNLIKQHFGLWVAMVLADRYGAENVYTYRQENGRNSHRGLSKAWKEVLKWVSSYTPHTLQIR